jgi:hypothetical protein
MIAKTDFSDKTLELYYECKRGNVSVYDFVTRLLNADFEVSEIKTFVRCEFGTGYSKTINLAKKLL